jgi:glutamyl-tRNA synthetase
VAKKAAPFALDEAQIAALGGGKARAPKPVRCRFAPSPTGSLHIGGARTALMNYLFAKRFGGTFVLRVEDTDTARNKAEHTQVIIDGLNWLGIKSDEPVVFQSQRSELYQQKIDQLIDQDLAYKDDTGAVYFRMPKEGALVVNDHVKGKVSFSAHEEGFGDYVIQRAPEPGKDEGTATFLLANVVDDGEMGITHIVRGDDHLSNAARQIPLYRALGYTIPQFYHVPLIHGDDGAKLSKRHGATSVLEYEKAGYDPVVLANHLAHLGMRVNTNDQVVPMDELAQGLDPWAFSKSAARIDFPKLNHVNREKIAEMETADIVADLGRRDPELFALIGQNGVEALAEGAKGRASTLAEIAGIGREILSPVEFVDATNKDFHSAEAVEMVRGVALALKELDGAKWSSVELEAAIAGYMKATNGNFRSFQRHTRWALTNNIRGLPLVNELAVLGKAESLKRLQNWTEL